VILYERASEHAARSHAWKRWTWPCAHGLSGCQLRQGSAIILLDTQVIGGGELGWAAESACACICAYAPAWTTLGRRRRELRLRRAGYVRAAILALQIRAFVRYHLLIAPRSQGWDGGHGHLLL